MKQRIKQFCCILLTLILVLAVVPEMMIAADSTVTVNVKGRYGQTEARTMLNMINEFRTGSEAWEWNPDNQTKKYHTNLAPLTYDYDLEQAAMLRAMEIALSFEHTRPNGTSCFTTYSGGACGENIAAGYSSAAAAFVGWQETDEDYSGQGHRRNMLSSSFTAIGIGHVYYNGCHYWVQEFRNPVIGTAATAANDGETVKAIDVLSSKLTVSIYPSVNTCTVTEGQSISMPTAQMRIKVAGAWPGGESPAEESVTWRIEDESIARIADDKIYGEKEGTTTLIASVLGKTASVKVTVNPAAAPKPTATPSPTGTPKPTATPTPAASISKVVPVVKKSTVSYNSATLSWNKIKGATGYAVYTSTSANGKYTRKNAGNHTTCTVRGLKTGKTYYIKVCAYQTINGRTVYSKYSSIQKVKPVLSVPSISSVKKAGTNTLSVTFKRVSGASGYDVYYSTSKNGKYQKIGTIKNNKTKTLVHKSTKIKNGASAYYRIRAYRTVDGKKVYSSYSAIKGVKIR
ncbi:MAG: CAP domain-containing protein [Eubacteriales bacterium]|nr:CAP domain-containing protein [Eubacteriales bacterium]